jgi:hypothetical protein
VTVPRDVPNPALLLPLGNIHGYYSSSLSFLQSARKCHIVFSAAPEGHCTPAFFSPDLFSALADGLPVLCVWFPKQKSTPNDINVVYWFYK